MSDDLLGELFGEIALGRGQASRRAQLAARLFFGLLGAGLCGFGAYHVAGLAVPPGLAEFHWAAVALFAAIGCFALFNVALGRVWRWPGRLVVASFVAMIVARLFLAG